MVRRKLRTMRAEWVAAAAALCLLGTGVANAQENVTVSGVVRDNVGQPVIGAAVMVAGTTQGTVTDLDGRYTIQVPADAKLMVTFIGYDDAAEEVGGRTTVDFTLFDSFDELEELMVIGYGTQKKSDLTGAIARVKADDILLNPSANPMEALQGKVAGLDIMKSSGQAGSGVEMQLRGTRSFTASGNPVFIIDGLPGDYSTLNPNDIESIEILKDAASTAVYGASGANGVVLITTKNGKDDKTIVNFNAYVGINGFSKLPEMRSGDSYVNTILDAQKAAGSDISDKKVALNNALASDEAWGMHEDGKYIDWADELLRNATIQSYSLSVAGGTEKSKSYLSLNFSDERGIFVNDNNKVYSSNIKTDYEVRKWLSIGANAQLSYVYGNRAYSQLQSILKISPLGELYDEEGNLNVNPSPFSRTPNPMLNGRSNYRNNVQNTGIYLNPYFEVRPIEGLTWLSRAQAHIGVNRRNYYQGIGTFQYYNNGGSATVGTNTDVFARITTSRSYDYKWENVITYKHLFAEVHDLTVTAVTSWNHNQNDTQQQIETDITNDGYLWHNMGRNGAAKSTVYSDYSMSKGMGLVGRVNYGYAGKYLASVSVRHDGSSKLAEDYRWDTFPAFSLGWRISEENFMASTRDWLDNLKIRFGWGVSGTANIAPYSSVSNVEQTTIVFSGENNMQAYRYGLNYSNEGLGWEKSYNTNIGLDLNAFDGRIDMAVDLYKTRTEGVIWNRQLPVTNGATDAKTFYQMAQNICETENKGIELQLNTVNFRNSDWEWRSTVTFAANHEEITKLIDEVDEGITNGNYALVLGEPVNSFYNYKKEGIWQTWEAEDAAAFGASPGHIKVATKDLRKVSTGVYVATDADGNEVTYDKEHPYSVSNRDYEVLGHSSPDWTLGFKNNVKWRNVDLSMFMFWRWGQTIRYNLLTDYDPTGVGNFPTYFNYWTAENGSNDFPGINSKIARLSDYTGYESLAFVDGSYFKIKNITLGYTLPKKALDRMGVSNLRVYGTITNPLVHAKSDMLKDYDPEQNGQIDYPLTKQLVFGVNLTF